MELFIFLNKDSELLIHRTAVHSLPLPERGHVQGGLAGQQHLVRVPHGVCGEEVREVLGGTVPAQPLPGGAFFLTFWFNFYIFKTFWFNFLFLKPFGLIFYF